MLTRAIVTNDSPKVAPRRESAWLAANAIALVAVGVFFRLWQLDHVPGINGDEAWYGVQAMKFVRGEALAWRTPTGNPLNPFFVLPLVGLHCLFAPSFLLLRIPAVASGLLALPVNYWFCQRTFDRRMAWVTTLLLAALPINVAYSRFGWDASQTLLATLPACYCALLAVREPQRASRWLSWSAAALLCAILVHPTNIFLTPAPLCAFAFLNKERLLAYWRTLITRSVRSTLTIAGCLAIGWLARRWVLVAVSRLLALDQYGEFAVNFLRLFNGITAYRFIAGSKMPAGWLDFDALDGLAWCLLIAGALGLAAARRSLQRPLINCLVCGWGLTLWGFFLIAGPQAIAPHYERYGLVLIAPTTILLSLGLCEWLTRRDVWRHLATNCLLATAWVLVLGVGVQYFGFIHQTGGESHLTFRTGAIEPKLDAFKQLMTERDFGQETWLAVDDYWNLHPLSYLALGRKNVRVDTLTEASRDSDFLRAASEGRAWLAGFSDATWWNEDAATWRRGSTSPRFDSPDFAGRPVVRLQRIGD